MLKSVYFMSQGHAQTYKARTNCAQVLISITDPDCEDVFFEEDILNQYEKVLRLKFLDVTEGDGVVQYYQVKNIFDLVQSLIFDNKPYELIVHCFMGASRSAAVGKWIAQQTRPAQMEKYHAANTAVLYGLRMAQAESDQRDNISQAIRLTGTQVIAYPFDLILGKTCTNCDGEGCCECS